MGSMHCRLYDENLVHNIIMSTGMAIADFLQSNTDAETDDIYEFLETHADSIIEDTIDQLNSGDDYHDKDDAEGPWPIAPEDM